MSRAKPCLQSKYSDHHRLPSSSPAGSAVHQTGNCGPWNIEERITCLESRPKSFSLQELIGLCRMCREKKDVGFAKRVYLQLQDLGLEADERLGNYVVPMLVDSGNFHDAQHVFQNLFVRLEHSWTSLIQGLLAQGELQSVLELFKEMQEDCVYPSIYTLLAVLKAASRLKCIERGQELHVGILKYGLEKDPIIGNSLLDMYVKCGSLGEARKVFKALMVQDVVSWNTLIAGFSECGFGEEALKCLEQMKLDSVAPNAVTFLCSLKACCSLGCIHKSHEIHTEIVKAGFQGDPYIGNTLVGNYSKFKCWKEAQIELQRLPVRDHVSWTTIIGGYAEHGLGANALDCFEQMQKEGIVPNAVTFVFVLKACGTIGAVNRGKQIHNDIPAEVLETESSVRNTLVDMYCKCGSLVEAQQVFDQLPNQDTVSWNVLIAGYADRGLGEEAFNSLEKMQVQGISPDESTFVCGLKACGIVRSIDRGQKIHGEVVKRGFESSSSIGNTIVDVYGKCGLLTDSQNIFDRLQVRTVVSWTALIKLHAEQGNGKEALNYLTKMEKDGVSPNAVTLACSLKACTTKGMIDRGREMHAKAVKWDLLNFHGYYMEKDHNKNLTLDDLDKVLLANTLIDMYGKCGNMKDSQKVFDAILSPDLVTWNALITGYARKGQCEFVFQIFDKMRNTNILPNGITFLNVLSVCNHAGLVDKGQHYFEVMSNEYHNSLNIEHYNCMVDILGRAGQFRKAIVMLDRMPFQPNLVTWCSLLGACRKWGNVELGKHAFDSIVRIDEKHDGAYILMFHIYVDAYMWDEAGKIETIIRSWKGSEKSWIEIGGIVHTFRGVDISYMLYKEICTKLRYISVKMEEEGHAPKLECLLQKKAVDVEGDQPCGHSEKLAVACGLMKMPKGTPIHIMKNFCVCNDCHAFMAFVSKLEEQHIVCRDRMGIHNFRNGKCFCK